MVDNHRQKFDCSCDGECFNDIIHSKIESLKFGRL